MKSSKPLVMVLIAVLVVWTALSAQGSELAPETWLPEKDPFSHSFSQPSPVLRTDYNAALPGVNALLPPFLKITREEVASQGLPPMNPSAIDRTYDSKDGSGSLFSLQRSFHGYFWDASGRIKNTNAKHGLVDFNRTFGPATPHIYLGLEKTKNNDEWRVGDDDLIRMMYGASIDYKVTDAFYVIPVLTYYDWSKQLEVTSKPDINREWIGGLQFRFLF